MGSREKDPQSEITLKKVAAHKTLQDVEAGDIPLIDYIGNDLAGQGAKKVANHMAYPSTLRTPADTNLSLLKAYQRRMVAINIHCMRNFSYAKAPKRKPATP